MSLAAVLFLGLTLGLRHAFDPDHVAAVTATVARHPRVGPAIAVGMLWGLGHAATVALAGGMLLALGTALPAWVILFGESLVGVIVLMMGIDLLLVLRRERLHVHAHEHDGAPHVHLHSHARSRDHGRRDHAHQYVGRRALLVGMAHGLAGSGALAVLAATATRSRAEGMVFLLVFGLGATLSMGVAALALAIPLRWSARSLRSEYWLRTASGIGAVAAGSLLLFTVASDARAVWPAW